MSEQYILNANGDPEPCNDLMAWGKWMKGADRKVALTEQGGVKVSTVFLGLDHSFGGATPILFETMVFGGPMDSEQDRYATKDDAIAGHKAMCERAGVKP